MQQKTTTTEGHKERRGRAPVKIKVTVIGTPCDDGLMAVAERMYAYSLVHPEFVEKIIKEREEEERQAGRVTKDE